MKAIPFGVVPPLVIILMLLQRQYHFLPPFFDTWLYFLFGVLVFANLAWIIYGLEKKEREKAKK